MALEKMKQTLIDTELKTLKESGLGVFPEVIVETWDPYSSAPERDKVFLRLTNAWLRLHPDGQVSLEEVEHGYYISQQLAESLTKEESESGQAKGVPLHHLEYTDIYPTKLEADTMKKPLIPIEKIDVHGAVIPYNSTILPSLITAAIEKFGNGKATKTQVIDYLTQPYPHGGGWFTRTATLINKVEQTLQTMTYKGALTYNEKTKEYTPTAKPTTTTLKGAGR